MSSSGDHSEPRRKRITLFALPPLVVAAVAGLAVLVGPGQPFGHGSSTRRVQTPVGPVDFRVTTGPVKGPSLNPSYMVDDNGGLDLPASPPAYLDGGRRIATLAFSSGSPTASTTFVPDTTHIFIRAFGGCAGPVPNHRLQVVVRVNTIVGYGQTCQQHGSASTATISASAFDISDPQADYSRAGVVAGKPTVLQVTATVTPAGSSFSAGSFVVYEQIPPSQYILPPAPKALTLPPAGDNPILLDPRNSTDNGTWHVSVTAGETIALHRGAPGRLVVACQGVTLYDRWQYDWSPATDTLPVGVDDESKSCVVDTPGGPRVELTITASWFSTAGWFVEDLQHPDPEPTVLFVCSAGGSTCGAGGVSYPSETPSRTRTR